MREIGRNKNTTSENSLVRSAMKTQRREWLPTLTLEMKAVSCRRITEDGSSKWGFEGCLRVPQIEESGKNTSGREKNTQKGLGALISLKRAQTV